MTPIDDEKLKRHRKSGFQSVILGCLFLASYGFYYLAQDWIRRYVNSMYVPSSDSGGDDFYRYYLGSQLLWLVALLIYRRYRREFH